ncbi:unnamed protein product [Trifolium pratense]|uniref:Uncharacterized protein n=1 Tax=Trifolium pratense TaxID=57577 RepID=A0ACB0I6W6_TRIPR|nr:unnamed protein product [Trifolium pratense]
MARKFENVKDVDDGKDLWKISVNVKEKWSNLKDGKESIELMVVDNKGDDIYVFIPSEVIHNSEQEIAITVNNTYTMQNFQVSKNDDLYKASHHVYKLRYKLDVEVGDGHVKATFVFWDRECEQLIGKSVTDNPTVESVVQKKVEAEPTTTDADVADGDDIVILTFSLSASDEIDPDLLGMKTPSNRSGNDLMSTSQDAELEDVIGAKAYPQKC